MIDEGAQAEVLAFLGDPHSQGGQAVRRIDTHAAVVFLAGERALKIKRAVHFPFLDYSTLAKRHAACEMELEVNRPFAPALYRRVVPITRASDGRLQLGGDGTPVEWAVEMRRFDETQTLDHVAQAGRLEEGMADELARAVAVMHSHAPVVAADPWIAKLEDILRQNEEAFGEFPVLFPAADAERLNRESCAALTRLRPLLAARGRAGLVRRCHGDLHLGNIVLIDGKPQPFDAIEFDPLIAAGDVLYDLAFLLMDLIERGLRATANLVLNRYLLASGRPEHVQGLATLPLFMSLRAAIRAKVMAAQLQHVEGAERDRRGEASKIYFHLALRLLSPAKPTLVAVGGLSGTGKSVLARELAPHLLPEPGALIVRSDVERKAMFGASETERLPAEAYRAEVNSQVYRRIADKAGAAVAAGHSAVVDAVFGRADERSAIEGADSRADVRFVGLFLVADLATRLKRVGGRVGDASDADAAIARQQEALQLDAGDWIKIDASGTLDETLKKARTAIGC